MCEKSTTYANRGQLFSFWAKVSFPGGIKQYQGVHKVRGPKKLTRLSRVGCNLRFFAPSFRTASGRLSTKPALIGYCFASQWTL